MTKVYRNGEKLHNLGTQCTPDSLGGTIQPMLKKYLFIFVAIAGLLDASFLTYERYSNYIPPCSENILFADCGKVLNSSYATIFGVPLALIGVFQYGLILALSLLAFQFHKRIAAYLLVLLTIIGFLASVYFVFLQVAVIGAICLYCLFSALTSTILFISMLIFLKKERKRLSLNVFHFIYTRIAKPVFFKIDPEIVHTAIVGIGQTFGSWPISKFATRFLIHQSNPKLSQTIAGINFPAPVGLAAGFDYEARLTNSLAPFGFGFQSVGTITNTPYDGNPKPMLGRLPKSKSLMVNKGFKNLGAAGTIAKLRKSAFPIPVGVSIGMTNTLKIKTQKESIADIITAFKKFEKAKVKNAYYELNISCPNLLGKITFYSPKNLEELLAQVDKLKLSKPLFMKMPIEKSDKETLAMLSVIAKHSPAGVIFGNLQKDRKNKAFVASEVAKFPIGNFSGKPTEKRSNELISLAYKNYGKKLIVIGCGGIFSAQDAYTKITLGASLLQLITGMIYEGPSLIMQINFGLGDLLEKDGFTHISQAIGSKSRTQG